MAQNIITSGNLFGCPVSLQCLHCSNNTLHIPWCISEFTAIVSCRFLPPDLTNAVFTCKSANHKLSKHSRFIGYPQFSLLIKVVYKEWPLSLTNGYLGPQMREGCQVGPKDDELQLQKHDMFSIKKNCHSLTPYTSKEVWDFRVRE